MSLMSGLSLPDKSFAYFNLTVTDNVYSRYDRGVHLSFNVYATDFASDPDIYISKKGHVSHIEDADWHSAREGSDQAIVHGSFYEIGDTFYVTVRCTNECKFDIKVNYAREYKLNEGKR
mmetsp:Transcript_8141/g.9780  ORF Transcript_8141/g.9780 Transcript_8141/m.9780 type:complete len:119 (-) Transcript_8141:4534-4890(-)